MKYFNSSNGIPMIENNKYYWAVCDGAGDPDDYAFKLVAMPLKPDGFEIYTILFAHGILALLEKMGPEGIDTAAGTRLKVPVDKVEEVVNYYLKGNDLKVMPLYDKCIPDKQRPYTGRSIPWK